MTQSTGNFMNYTDFLKNSTRPVASPRIWKGRDIHEQLYGTDASLSEGRGAVSLVNEDTGDSYGIAPNINGLVQVLKPQEHGNPHRHSNMAIFVVFEGEGYSIIEGEKIEWEKGDVFFAPAWLSHEHCNTSEDQDAVLYTFQDVTELSRTGSWFLEEPTDSGAERIVEGTAESDILPEK
ncbi:MAG TPA: cupin domain-containing protein [Pseudogracilibacillus sp.]|nr:cupin domain-containing protein [Pseudogracilibacillus sp.]